MIFTETRLKGAFIVDVQRLEDDRGYFARTFSQDEFRDHGLEPVIAQANVSFNGRRGTLRGMHFQFPPSAEPKYVHCTRGAILDVVVDLRPESETYLEHVAVELAAKDGRGLYCPRRVAHGYQTLTDDTEVSYLIGDFYAPELAAGLRYDDERLGITWPMPVTVISDRDRGWPLLAQAEDEVRRRMTIEAVSA